jgi:hypothetical protein
MSVVSESERAAVPQALRNWFVVHFVADWLFAIPLFVAPNAFLRLLGWQQVDPISARIVAAALVGIGTQSLIGRNEHVIAFRAMLNLKVLWSATATLGILWSVLDGGPVMGWGFVAIFAGFNALWSYWRWRLRER